MQADFRYADLMNDDVFKLVLALIATAVPSYYIAITLVKF